MATLTPDAQNLPIVSGGKCLCNLPQKSLKFPASLAGGDEGLGTRVGAIFGRDDFAVAERGRPETWS
jgi:hypothetical protein